MLKRYNPFRLIVAVPALVILTLIVLLIMSPLAKSAAERAASLALKTDVRFDSFRISPLTGSLEFTKLRVQDRDRPGDNALEATRGEGRLSIWQLLRGRGVIDELLLSGVRCNVERTEDGSFSIGRLGSPEEPPTEEAKEQARKTDWVEALKKLAQKVKEWREKADREEKDREAGKREPPPAEAIRIGRATYVDREEPRLVIRRIRIEELELNLNDRSRGEKLPPLVKGEATIENLSSNPRCHTDPIAFALGGRFGAEGDLGILGLDGGLGLLRGQEASFGLNLNAESLALSILKPLFGLSLPVTLEQGVGDVTSRLKLEDFSALDLVPRVVTRDLVLKQDGKHDKVLGIPAKEFCEAVNHAKAFTIDGLTIAGTLSEPEFRWNAEFQESLKKLLADAGKAYLAAEVDKHLGKEGGRIQKEAEKILGKQLGGEATKKAEDILKGGLKLLPGLGPAEKKK